MMDKFLAMVPRGGVRGARTINDLDWQTFTKRAIECKGFPGQWQTRDGVALLNYSYEAKAS
jgi:hypothetical protein